MIIFYGYIVPTIIMLILASILTYKDLKKGVNFTIKDIFMFLILSFHPIINIAAIISIIVTSDLMNKVIIKGRKN